MAQNADGRGTGLYFSQTVLDNKIDELRGTQRESNWIYAARGAGVRSWTYRQWFPSILPVCLDRCTSGTDRICFSAPTSLVISLVDEIAIVGRVLWGLKRL
jgi:hypothetical protein